MCKCYVLNCHFMSFTFITFMSDVTLGGRRNYVMQTLCPLLCVTAGLYCCTSRFPRCSEGVWLWKLFSDLRTCIPVSCRLILVGPTHPPFSAPNLKFRGHFGIEEWQPLHTHPHAGADGLHQTQTPSVCNVLHNSSIYTA